MRAGYSAIVDATFIDAGERAAIAEVAARAGVAFTGLWLTAPDAVLLDRVAKRRGDASDADVAVLTQQLKADLGAMSWRPVDVSGNEAAALAGARAALGHGQGLIGRPAASASLTSSERLRDSSFSSTRARWTSTVRGEISRSKAITLFCLPRTISSKTSRSRGVSEASFSRADTPACALARCAAKRVCALRDGIEDGLLLERLLDEIDRACLHGPHCQGDVGMAGHDHDRKIELQVGEALLQLHPVHVGHLHVGNDAAGLQRRCDLEKADRGRIARDVVPGCFELNAQ